MYQDGIVILDFGGTQAHSIAKKVRSAHVFSAILPCDAQMEQIAAYAPRGLILAGGDGDPFSKSAASVDEAIFSLKLPVLGFGYGAGALLRRAGAMPGEVRQCASTMPVTFAQSQLFSGLDESERMLECIYDVVLPQGYEQTAVTGDGALVAFESAEQRLYGAWFYPEPNDPDGFRILSNFALEICQAKADWGTATFLEQMIAQVRRQVHDDRALIAVSGGVDSAVCAALMLRAIGNRLSCVHVDTALSRKGERELVQRYFDESGVDLQVIDAQERFLTRLRGIRDRHQKRLAVYEEYEQVVEDYMRRQGDVHFLAQGTIYDDVLSGQTFSNEGRDGLIEPLRMLFKEEVRELGALLALPDELVNRQPFPSAGLSVRCVGEATKAKLDMVREADWVLRQEIIQAGLDKRIRQFFAVLIDIQTGGISEPGHAIALRAVNQTQGGKATVYRLPYDLLERIVDRITGEVSGVNRVVYDLTGKPPASIEWN